jgi:ketosteroid isomerase-like protein
MSQQYVELVAGLQPAPDVDIAELMRSEQAWSALADMVAPYFHADCTIVAPGVPGTEKTHFGLAGLRSAWLEWLEPWLTYRTEIKHALDAGDRVLLLTNDYGRRDGATQEVRVDGSAVWTLSDGKVAAANFYVARSEAFTAAGLPESGW